MNICNGRAKLADSLSFVLFLSPFFRGSINARLNASTRITARPKHNDKLLGTLRQGQVTRRMGPTKGARYPRYKVLLV